jgi:hypothetical protein
MATATFDHEVNDIVYVLDRDGECINRGTVYQVTILSYLNSDEEIETEISYIVLLDLDSTTKTVEEDDIFAVYADASAELFTILG